MIHYLRIELIERYNFYFQVLIKRKIPGQKIFSSFSKNFPWFSRFPRSHNENPGFSRFSRSAGNPVLVYFILCSHAFFNVSLDVLIVEQDVPKLHQTEEFKPSWRILLISNLFIYFIFLMKTGYPFLTYNQITIKIFLKKLKITEVKDKTEYKGLYLEKVNIMPSVHS